MDEYTVHGPFIDETRHCPHGLQWDDQCFDCEDEAEMDAEFCPEHR